MAFTDYTAADKLRELREGAGYNSAEALALGIRAASFTADWKHRGTVDAWTIRKVEAGHVPGPRIRFVLARYFDLDQADIWQPRNWKAVDVSIALAGRALA
jgi:hypothetical protein